MKSKASRKPGTWKWLGGSKRFGKAPLKDDRRTQFSATCECGTEGERGHHPCRSRIRAFGISRVLRGKEAWLGAGIRAGSSGGAGGHSVESPRLSIAKGRHPSGRD